MAEPNADNENIENSSNPGFIINNTPMNPSKRLPSRLPTGSDKITAPMNENKGTD